MRYIRLVLHHSWEWLFYIPPIARAILRVDIKMAVIIVLINSHEDIFANISGHVLLDTIKIDLDVSNPLGRESRTSFLHLQQVYSVYCNFLITKLKRWRLRGRESKKPGTFLLYDECHLLNRAVA